MSKGKDHMTLSKAKKRLGEMMVDLETSDSTGADRLEDLRDAKAIRLALVFLDKISQIRGPLADLLNELQVDDDKRRVE